MKKGWIIAGAVVGGVVLVSCVNTYRTTHRVFDQTPRPLSFAEGFLGLIGVYKFPLTPNGGTAPTDPRPLVLH